MKIVPLEHSKLAKTDQQLLDLFASDADWFVRTPEDLKQLRAAPESVLAKLSPEDFEIFANKLVFRNGGVAGGYYKPLTSSLNLPDVRQVFGHMGMSMELFSPLDESNDSCQECECSSGGTCDFNYWYFCNSACGSQ